MIIQLLLIGLALLIRGLGAIGRAEEEPIIIRLLGWLLAGLGAWLGMVAAGGWPPLWSLFVVLGLPLLGLLEKRPFSPFTLLADALVVFSVGLFGLPPMAMGRLLVIMVLLVAAGAVVDWLVSVIKTKIPRQWLGGLTAVLLLLIVFVPPTSETVSRILETRFAYLLPEPVADVAPTPTLQPNVTPNAVTPVVPIVMETAVVQPTPSDATATAEPTPKQSYPTVTAKMWTPYVEWQAENSSYEGNPFDLIATATFRHEESGETHTTGLFYSGENKWNFRFAGTQLGNWTFVTQSDDPELNGLTGQVVVEENPDTAGFVTHYGDKWGRIGIDEPFAPQYVMIGNPQTYYNNPAEIEHNIQTFFVEHGFNGVHTPVFCRWFDIEQQRCSGINEAEPNPDMRTFEALEALILEVHEAGGVVHIWMWGDDSRSENPKRWGLNGTADLRLQRYIAARLGPLPGWTMGYGYDLYEWVNTSQLDEWYTHMQNQLGWEHYLGARGRTDSLNQLSQMMSYASYEQHKPSYEDYVAAIEQFPNKPAFSEDRFRIRNQGRAKDYTMEETRRGLWHSMMAGGVANIWGNLIGAPRANDSLTTSAPYPNPEMIQTFALFWEDRFFVDMVRCNERTSGLCLMSPSQELIVFYQENSDSMTIDLSGANGGTAVAVDTKLAYAEIDLGTFTAGSQTWEAPYVSDWVIVVERP